MRGDLGDRARYRGPSRCVPCNAPAHAHARGNVGLWPERGAQQTKEQWRGELLLQEATGPRPALRTPCIGMSDAFVTLPDTWNESLKCLIFLLLASGLSLLTYSEGTCVS